MSGSAAQDATIGPVRSAPGAGGALRRLAGQLTIASGVVAAVGVAFLIAMFASFAVGAASTALVFGRINDVLVLVGYLLAAPSVLALWAVLRPRAGLPGDLAALVALAAIGSIVVLQLLLIAGALTFEEQVGPVSLALLVLGAWFVVVGRIGSASGLLPRGARMGLLAATYVGYPVWAFRLGRILAAGTGGVAEHHPDAG